MVETVIDKLFSNEKGVSKLIFEPQALVPTIILSFSIIYEYLNCTASLESFIGMLAR